jgi:hypothetical protein
VVAIGQSGRVNADTRLARIRRSLDRDPWRPLYPFPSARALQRDADMTAKIHEALAKADAATSEHDRAMWIRIAFGHERNRQSARTFRFNDWLRWAVAIAVLFPWALFARAGYGPIGFLLSALVALAVWVVRHYRRKA